MYTDDDLENAVKNGIFTKESIQRFRSHISVKCATQAVDEENFRLIASFNDIFVVIACTLLLFSTGWVTHNIHPSVAMGAILFLSWVLAEFFVLKRKMALPAIILLITFVGSTFAFTNYLFEHQSEQTVMVSGAVASLATWLHWKRFKVAITVAAGAATAVVFAISLLMSINPGLENYILYLIFISGVITFYIAMLWDSRDLKRVTSKSDVAFWLHLVSAPLIVHPIFSNLGILKGNESTFNVVIVVALYLFLTIASVAIDRRAFMVSSLAYVLYTLTELFRTYGFAGDSFAYVGVIMGFSLLLLSGFWHNIRSHMVIYLPKYLQNKVPPLAENKRKIPTNTSTEPKVASSIE